MLMFPNYMMSVYTPCTAQTWTQHCDTIIHKLLYVLRRRDIGVQVGGKPTSFQGKFSYKSKHPKWRLYDFIFQLISLFFTDPYLSQFWEQKAVDWTFPKMHPALCDNSFLEELFSCRCLALHLYAAGNYGVKCLKMCEGMYQDRQTEIPILCNGFTYTWNCGIIGEWYVPYICTSVKTLLHSRSTVFMTF